MGFAGLSKATLVEKGEWFEEGEYRFRINRVVFKKTRKAGESVFIEGTVLTSKPLDGSDIEPAPVGSKRTHMISGKDEDLRDNNCLSFLAGVLALDSKKDAAYIEEKFKKGGEAAQLMDAAVGEDNALEGVEVNVKVKNIKTKTGGDFSLHLYSGVEYPAGQRPTVADLVKGNKPTYGAQEAPKPKAATPTPEVPKLVDGVWVTPDMPNYPR